MIDYLSVLLHLCTIMAAKFTQSRPPQCISKLAPLRPLSSHNQLFSVHLCVHSISSQEVSHQNCWLQSPSSLDHGLQLHLLTHPIIASKFAESRPPNASHESVHDSVIVLFWVQSIAFFSFTSNSSQGPPIASPDIQCVQGYLYRYIDKSTNRIH